MSLSSGNTFLITLFIYYFQDLAFKNQLFKDQQEKRFEQERSQLTKQYEGDLQAMIDSQKRQVLAKTCDQNVMTISKMDLVSDPSAEK